MEQAEATNTAVETTEETAVETKPEAKAEKKTEKESKPEVDVQALLTELAKTKRALDKASSEAASYKKQYKETLSEKEQYDLEAAEKQAEHDAEFESMKERLALAELKEQFVSLGYSKDQAATAAKAQYENDVDTLLKVQEQFTKDRIEAEKQKILADLPQPNIGTGGATGHSKEEFDNMSLVEKSKLFRENKAEYDRLIKL